MIQRTILLLLFLLFSLPEVWAQTEDKIREEIDSMIEHHPLRVAIFRVAPQISITGGYDSNVLTTAQLPVADNYASVAPGVDAAVKLGHRGYIAVQEQLNFLYYQDLKNLRDIYTDTKGRFVTGSRKTLLELSGGYVSKKAPINFEFDQPAQQMLTSGGVNLEFAMRPRTDLRLHAELGESRYEAIPDHPPQTPLPADSRSTGYGVALAESVGRLTKVTVDGTAGKTKFLNQPENSNYKETSNYWNVLGGLEFDSRKLNGHAKAGYGQTDSTAVGQGTFNDVLVDAAVNYEVRRRLSIGVFGQRKRSVSAFVQNSFSLSTYGGVRGSFPLARRFFLDGKFTAGNNNYNGQPVTGTDVVITKDRYIAAEAGFNFELRQDLVLRFSATRWNRNSNVPSLNKDRTTFGGGLVIEP